MPQAEQLQREALEIWQQSGHKERVADASRCLGHLMVAAGEQHHAEARHYFRQALALATKHQMAPVALDVCVVVAQLLTQTGALEQAAELLVLAEQHAASTFDTRKRAKRLLASLPPQATSAALQRDRPRGGQRDLWTTVQELLTTLQRDGETTPIPAATAQAG